MGLSNSDDIDTIGPIGIDSVGLKENTGGVDASDLGNLTRACDIWGMTSVARIHQNEQGLIYRTLDRNFQLLLFHM